ncbi:hypothetical protein J6590_069852 [Homalodisca vitripennis]|nr:hypothetical protein J6590_069852 [Homalodisca vitripennis]
MNALGGKEMLYIKFGIKRNLYGENWFIQSRCINDHASASPVSVKTYYHSLTTLLPHSVFRNRIDLQCALFCVKTLMPTINWLPCQSEKIPLFLVEIVSDRINFKRSKNNPGFVTPNTSAREKLPTLPPNSQVRGVDITGQNQTDGESWRNTALLGDHTIRGFSPRERAKRSRVAKGRRRYHKRDPERSLLAQCFYLPFKGLSINL